MNFKSFAISSRVFAWLLWFDLRFLVKDFWQNLIDSAAWPTALIAVNGYVLPAMGMPANYGAFVAVSMLIIMASFTAWTGAATLAADLAGPREISYELTLPLPYWMVWLKCGLYLAIKAAVFNISSLLIGKILLGSIFDLSAFSFARFIGAYGLSCLFFGMFAIWATVIVKGVESHSRLELRLTGPLFFLCGWSSSWATMNAVSPALGKFLLCMPWLYAYEGTRGAITGAAGYLPFWLCAVMLALFAAVFYGTGLWMFKKRMDCV